MERCAVVVVSGDRLDHPAMIILALRAGEELPATAEVGRSGGCAEGWCWLRWCWLVLAGAGWCWLVLVRAG